MNDALHIGTCSWKYDSWQGLIYEPGDEDNYLRAYARHYGSVEIDQWFWSLFGEERVLMPKPEVIAEYAAAVPETFRFTIKAPNSLTLTHYPRNNRNGTAQPNPWFLSVELYQRFLKSLTPLVSRIGAIMLQFGYLNRQKMASQQAFLHLLGRFLEAIPRDLNVCVETRNPNYLNRSHFDLLNEQCCGHVFSQGYYMPDIVDVYRKCHGQLQGTQVIRLLGPDREGIEKRTGKRWDRRAEPRDDELDVISKMVRHMVEDKGLDLYLNVNNHYEGSAPHTIHHLTELLEEA